VRRAFDDGLASYEFCGSDEPHKLEWAGGARTYDVLHVFSAGAAGRLEQAAYTYGRPVARRLRASGH
jgi:hypothetical protein